MDWKVIDFDWNHAKAFLVTAQEGSLTAASKALGISQPTLGRQVASLEESLGVNLFERSGRGLELTPSGAELLGYIQTMSEAATQFSLAASGKSDALEGLVTISATEVMAVYLLPPIIEQLCKQTSGLCIDIISSNQTSDLKRREADIAIRAFRPTEPDLIAKKIRDLHYHLYATPAYLASIGNPKNKQALSKAKFIGYDQSSFYIDVLNEGGIAITEDNFSAYSQSSLSNWALVKQGLGIGVMQEEIGDDEALVCRALAKDKFPPSEIWLVAHKELKVSRKIRHVFDFLAGALG